MYGMKMIKNSMCFKSKKQMTLIINNNENENEKDNHTYIHNSSILVS